MRPLLRSCVLLAALLFVSAPAWASHYLLDDVDIFAEGERDAVAGAGVIDTEVLLAQILTPAGREAFSSRSGIAAERLAELAAVCELLQVEGVGPRAARLLMAAGVTGTADLAAREPADLLALVIAANGVGGYTTVNPSIDHVSFWVIGAAQASQHVEY